MELLILHPNACVILSAQLMGSCRTSQCSIFTNCVPRVPDTLPVPVHIYPIGEKLWTLKLCSLFPEKRGISQRKSYWTKGKTNQMLSTSRIYCDLKILKWTWTLQKWTVFFSLPTPIPVSSEVNGLRSLSLHLMTLWPLWATPSSQLKSSCRRGGVLYPHHSMRRDCWYIIDQCPIAEPTIPAPISP